MKIFLHYIGACYMLFASIGTLLDEIGEYWITNNGVFLSAMLITGAIFMLAGQMPKGKN